MQFSVLMSIYKNDDPRFLCRALSSIYEEQSRKPDEIVLVYDGALTQELYKTVENFRKDKINIVKICALEKNMGLGEALRIGSSLCSYEYILRMDADDISTPNRFEKQISYIERNPRIDVLGADIAEFEVDYLNEKKRIRHCPRTHNDIVKMSHKRNPMNHVAVCIKKKALQEVGGYESLPLLEDYFLWLKMIVNNCRLENLSEPLVWVRVGNGFNKKRGSKARIKGWSILQKFMLDNHLISKIEAYLNMIYIYVFVYMPPGIKKIVYRVLLRK